MGAKLFDRDTPLIGHHRPFQLTARQRSSAANAVSGAVAVAPTLVMEDGSPPEAGREAAEAVVVSGAATDVGNTAIDGVDADAVPEGKASAALSVAATPPNDSSAVVASGALMEVDPPGGRAGGDSCGGASAATAAAGEADLPPRATSPAHDSGASDAGADDNLPVTVVDMSHEPTGGLGVGYTLPATVEVSVARLPARAAVD